MRQALRLWLTCAVLAVLVAGCPRRRTDNDAGPDVAATAQADAQVTEEPAAANAASVARFGDENKIADEAAALTTNTVARIEPPNGQPVANLTKGTSVTKIADHEGFALVVFTDPKNQNQQLMGWVPGKDVGESTAAGGSGGGTGTGTGPGTGTGGHVGKKGDAGAVASAAAEGGTTPPAVTCKSNEVGLLFPKGTCAKKCRNNGDCPSGKSCVPTATILNGAFASVCIPP